ncbi:MAG: hypothetical protein ACOC2H_00630 [Spirochaetota bacterium]
MHTIYRMLLLVLFGLLASDLYSMEYDISGTVAGTAEKNYQKKSSLNPGNVIDRGYPLSGTASADVTIGVKLNDAASTTFSDTAYVRHNSYRTNPGNEDEWEYDNTVRQLYGTAAVGSRLFIDAGRKVERSGVSFYRNPSDFFVSAGETNLVLSKSEQDKSLVGTTLLKAQFFATSRLVLGAVYAPEIEVLDNDLHQIQGRVSYQLDWSDVDVICYYGDGVKLGSNLSANIGDAAGAHVEFGISDEKKRYRLAETKIPPGAPQEGRYYAPYRQTMDHPWEMIVGGHYTFSDASNLYAEYYYNHSGYTQSEWDDLMDIADTCNDISFFFNEVSMKYLNRTLQKSGGLTSVRRHYLFLRYAKDDIFFNDFNIASVVVAGLENPGGLVTISPEYEFTDNAAGRADMTVFGGTSKSEYELMYHRFGLLCTVEYVF